MTAKEIKTKEKVLELIRSNQDKVLSTILCEVSEKVGFVWALWPCIFLN